MRLIITDPESEFDGYQWTVEVVNGDVEALRPLLQDYDIPVEGWSNNEH